MKKNICGCDNGIFSLPCWLFQPVPRLEISGLFMKQAGYQKADS